MQNAKFMRKYKVESSGKCDSYNSTEIIPDEIFLVPPPLKLTSPIARGELSDEYSSLSEQERTDWPLFYPAVISHHLITSLTQSHSLHSSLVHSHWSRNVEAWLSLVESFRVLLCQLSYAIKNPLVASKAPSNKIPPLGGILLAPRWFFMA